jgi:hypothetical protein
MRVLAFLLSLISITLVFCGEVTYFVNVKNPVNVISENFISFEVNFTDLIELSRQGKNLKFLHQISPSCIKILNFSQKLVEPENDEISLIVDIMKTLK